MYYAKLFLLALIPGLLLGAVTFNLMLQLGILDGQPMGNVNAYVITSGSMEPQLHVGSVVITQSKSAYKVGDIVTFNVNGKKEQQVTHRIVGINRENGEFITKGDANDDHDPATLSNPQIVGKASISIPYLGYAVEFAKTPKGFIALVIIPATIIIYEEFKTISGEIQKTVKKLFKRGEGRVGSSSKAYWRAAVILPVLGLAFIITALSTAYFSDTEVSTNNVLGAAESFPTPSSSPAPSSTLVINEVYYDPDEAHTGQSGGEASFEWVELYNPSTTQSVNIKNWIITDATDNETTIVNGNLNIGPLGFLVIGKSANIANLWGLEQSLFHSMGDGIGSGLNDTGDSVILKDSSGVVIDSMSYGNNTDIFNPAANPISQGHSLERNPDGVDTNTATDFVDRSIPTPGS